MTDKAPGAGSMVQEGTAEDTEKLGTLFLIPDDYEIDDDDDDYEYKEYEFLDEDEVPSTVFVSYSEICRDAGIEIEDGTNDDDDDDDNYTAINDDEEGMGEIRNHIDLSIYHKDDNEVDDFDSFCRDNDDK